MNYLSRLNIDFDIKVWHSLEWMDTKLQRSILGQILFILYVSDLEEGTCSKLVIQNQREGQSIQRRDEMT